MIQAAHVLKQKPDVARAERRGAEEDIPPASGSRVVTRWEDESFLMNPL